MRFTALPVHSFEDATLDLEQLQTLLTAPSGQSLPFLQLLAAKNAQIAYGTGSVIFAASTVSSTATVNHGLGRTPAIVLATSITFALPYATFTYTTSTFQCQAQAFASTTGTTSFNWLAIG